MFSRAHVAFILFFLFACTHSFCSENVLIHADLLYWKAREKSLVLTNEKSPLFFTDNFTKTKVIHPHFDWNWGYRLGLGYLFPCSSWEVTLDWTHYQTSISQHRCTNSNDLTNLKNQQGMFPIWALSSDIIAGDYVTDATLNGKLKLNLLDLDFDRSIGCGDYFELIPYVGVRSGWIKQKATIHYSGGIFFTEILHGGVSLNGTDHVHLKNNFWGMGPRIGIRAELSQCEGFGLYLDGAISGLIGTFSVKQKETYLDANRYCRDKNLIRFRWIGDAAAGMLWKTFLCEYVLTFRLGWEYHIFFHQVELKRDSFDLVPRNRNLDVQGATLSGQFNF